MSATTTEIPAHIIREIYAELCASLPPPVRDTDEGRATRNEAALATLQAMRPADAFEARVAVQVIANSMHAMDCMRLCNTVAGDFGKKMQCLNQASSLSRNMLRSRALLEKLQNAAYRRAQIEAQAANTAAAQQPAAAPGAPPSAPTAAAPAQPAKPATPTARPTATPTAASPAPSRATPAAAQPTPAAPTPIARGNPPPAPDAATQELLRDMAGNPALAEAVNRIGIKRALELRDEVMAQEMDLAAD